jgi:hypothetical protein
METPFMALDDRYKHPPPLSDLLTWKRVRFYAALGFSVLIAGVGADKGLTVYGTAPDHPVPDKGQISPVDVDDGHIRYPTASEKESFDVWAGRAGSRAGAAFTRAFFLWTTSHKKTISHLR